MGSPRSARASAIPFILWQYVDGEGTLREGTKLGVEEHGAGFPVVEELLLDAEPGDASRDAIVLVNVVEEVGGDGVEDPGDNHVVHA
jgi:hypothetical protein